MKSFYVVVKLTSGVGGEWGKSKSLKKAIELSGVKKLNDRFLIYQAIVSEDATDEEIENLMLCYSVSKMGSVVLYANPSEEDVKMIDKLIIGWHSELSFFESEWIAKN